MKSRGFTIVELIITISIAAILLTLGVVNLRGSQMNGRDAERKIDIETIAQHLETYYNSGTDNSTSIGAYPSTAAVSTPTTILRDVDVKSLEAPNIDDPSATFVSASNSTQSTSNVLFNQTTPTSQSNVPITVSQYVYQPLRQLSDGTWSLCTDSATQECRKFNLYYKLEVPNVSANCPSPGDVCMITSQNQ